MPGHGANAVIFDRIGLIGVPLFMICAGYFNNSKEGDFSTWIDKKWRTLIIPWLIWGTITYLLHILKSKDIELISYLKWMVGVGTWLYFVPILLCCQIFSRYINLYVLLCLGLISMFFSAYHLIPYNDVFTPYVNPFNFIVYFVAGSLIRNYGILKYFESRWCGVLIIGVLLLALFKPVYWHPLSPAVALILFFACYSLFFSFNGKVLTETGKVSFVIYLCHIQVAGMVNQLMSNLWGTPYEFAKVIIAFLAVNLMVIGVKYVINKLNLVQVGRYLGYR